MKIYFIILFLFVVLSGHLNAQQPSNNDKKVYTTQNGKIFINKDQGIYLWISTSPDAGSEKIRLSSDSSKKYTNPMYLDTEGYNTFRSPWAVDTISKKVILPLQDVIFEVYADGNPPVSKALFNATYSKIIASKKYYGSSLSVSIKSEDAVSGVKKLYYTLNGESFAEYASPLSSFKEGENFIKYYATDFVGNTEQTKENIFYIDNTPPKTEYEIVGLLNENYVAPDATIKLSSKDSLSGVKAIYYTINNGPNQQYLKPIPVSLIATNEGSVRFYAEDNLGNKEEVKIIGGKNNNLQIQGSESDLVFEFYVDKDPPVISIDIEGDSYKGKYYFISQRSKIKVTATDEKAGVEKILYSINTESVKQEYKEPVSINESGLKYFRTKAIDYVGNTSAILTNSFFCDSKAPQTKISIGQPKYFSRDTMFIASRTKIKLAASDDNSGVAQINYRIDANESASYNAEITVNDAGSHTLTFNALDKVNNQEKENQQNLFIDNIPPIIHHHFSVESIGTKTIRDELTTIYPSNVMLYIAATDANCGGEKIEYTINDGPVATSNPLKSLLPGNYSIKVKAFDVLGNESSQIIKFSIEE